MTAEREIQSHDPFNILTLAKLCVLIANCSKPNHLIWQWMIALFVTDVTTDVN